MLVIALGACYTMKCVYILCHSWRESVPSERTKVRGLAGAGPGHLDGGGPRGVRGLWDRHLHLPRPVRGRWRNCSCLLEELTRTLYHPLKVILSNLPMAAASRCSGHQGRDDDLQYTIVNIVKVDGSLRCLYRIPCCYNTLFVNFICRDINIFIVILFTQIFCNLYSNAEGKVSWILYNTIH